MKKIVSIVLVVMLLLCNGISVLAEENTTPPANQISDNPIFAEDEKVFPFSTNSDDSLGMDRDGFELVVIRSGISKASSSSVKVSVTTTGNTICLQIGGISSIQRWYNNEWQRYYTFSFWDYGVSTCSDTRTITVESGYYYRITTTHKAFSPESMKIGYTTTTSILVN